MRRGRGRAGWTLGGMGSLLLLLLLSLLLPLSLASITHHWPQQYQYNKLPPGLNTSDIGLVLCLMFSVNYDQPAQAAGPSPGSKLSQPPCSCFPARPATPAPPRPALRWPGARRSGVRPGWSRNCSTGCTERRACGQASGTTISVLLRRQSCHFQGLDD